mmetsp:Transcript_15585/g.43079  ORF Transcript_15585/g.43079 Transcript_15585/m.43079 type:complete len:111 (-) Transcript_15585:174-506(-)
MALSLLNYLYWEIPEARIPFIIADAIVLISLGYAERRVQSNQKMVQEKVEHQVVQEHEMEKAAKQGQQLKTRRAKNMDHQDQKRNRRYVGNRAGGKPSHFNIQQPSGKGD